MNDVVIRPISAVETRWLRHTVLRPHQRPDELVYPGDDDPAALHAGAFRGAALVGVASVAPSPCPAVDLPAPWRLQGMAIAAELRGLGLGRALIAACLEHIAAHAGRSLWCNGRSGVAGFYTTLGFAPVGEEFLSATGPHFVFVRPVPHTIGPEIAQA